MELLQRLWSEEDGQGLVEYTLIVVLVALCFGLPSRTPMSVISSRAVGARLLPAWVVQLAATPLHKVLPLGCRESVLKKFVLAASKEFKWPPNQHDSNGKGCLLRRGRITRAIPHAPGTFAIINDVTQSHRYREH